VLLCPNDEKSGCCSPLPHLTFGHEREQVERFASVLGISSDELSVIIEHLSGKSAAAPEFKAINTAAKISSLFVQLVDLIVADEVVTKRELSFTKTIGRNFGMVEADVGDVANAALGIKERAPISQEGRSLSQLVKLPS
jgi:hypothetical protein